MTRALTTEDSGDEYIQFRGYQSFVTIDEFNVRFAGEVRSAGEAGQTIGHESRPVADPELIAAGDAPQGAIRRDVAEALTDGDLSNPLVCWGVACEYHNPETDETCDEVFDTPRALNGHQRSHYSGQSSDGDSEDSDDSEGSGESTTEADASTAATNGAKAPTDGDTTEEQQTEAESE